MTSSPATARCDLCPGLDRRKDGLIAVVTTTVRLAEGHDNWGWARAMIFCVCFSELNWDTSTGRPYYKSSGENVCVRFGWGDDLGKHAPARHGLALPFGRTRSKRIVGDPACNQCLGACRFGQTLVKSLTELKAAGAP